MFLAASAHIQGHAEATIISSPFVLSDGQAFKAQRFRQVCHKLDHFWHSYFWFSASVFSYPQR